MSMSLGERHPTSVNITKSGSPHKKLLCAAQCVIFSSWEFFVLVTNVSNSTVLYSPDLILILSSRFIDRAYLAARTACTHRFFIDIGSSGYPLCTCARGASGPCLFYLVGRVVVLQNKRPEVNALLCEWALLYLYRLCFLQQCFGLPSHPVLFHETYMAILKVRVNECDLQMPL